MMQFTIVSSRRATQAEKDAATQHEIYVSSKEDAIDELRQHSDFAINESNENADNDAVTVSARRLS